MSAVEEGPATARPRMLARITGLAITLRFLDSIELGQRTLGDHRRTDDHYLVDRMRLLASSGAPQPVDSAR